MALSDDGFPSPSAYTDPADPSTPGPVTVVFCYFWLPINGASGLDIRFVSLFNESSPTMDLLSKC